MTSNESLNVYVLTFNCARNLVDSTELASSLLSSLPSTTAPLPDILALSLQEIAPIANSFLGGSLIKPYLTAIAQTVTLAASQRLHDNGNAESQDSPALVHVLTRHVGLTALMIFALPEIKSRIEWIKSASVGCGLWEMGNKGAVGARLGIETASDANEKEFEITFVAAHLAPHEQNVERRNQDFATIVRNLGFTDEQAYLSKPHSKKDAIQSEEEEQLLLPDTVADQSSDALGLYDTTGLVFFAGDLNYRTSPIRPTEHDPATYPQPNHPTDSPQYYLNYLSRDQLNQEKNSNRTLQHFSELDIRFPPTYKYAHDTHTKQSIQPAQPGDQTGTWNWASHRWPSWCDRILYFPSLASSKSHTYDALPIQASSDHRPVALSVSVKPQQVHSTFTSPFPLNPNFASVRRSARRLEILVGVLSYLGLTKEGKTILAGIVAGAIASWYVVHSIL